MSTPSIARLGHIGIHVLDLEKQKAFYRDILGLTVSDEDPELGMVFMSSRPDDEHHELLLCRGRNVDDQARVVQQVSFRCNTLEDVVGFYRRFKEHGVKLDMIISHGNAIGVYGFDPEGNFWVTDPSSGVAVEINCRPERQDPPDRLLELAAKTGCLFAIDTDAHAPGQLDWLQSGCDRAEAAGLTADRVINTRPADQMAGNRASRASPTSSTSRGENRTSRGEIRT